MGKKQGGRQNERPDTALQVTSPLAWKRPGVMGDLVELPSGNVVRCLRPGMQNFLELGLIPNALLPQVEAALGEHKLPKISEVMEDVTLLEAAARFTDDVVMYCVKDPEILPVPPDPEEERIEGALYIDDVEMEDRVFIFQFAVGGTRSVQRFRQLQAADMATLAAESVSEDEAQQPA